MSPNVRSPIPDVPINAEWLTMVIRAAATNLDRIGHPGDNTQALRALADEIAVTAIATGRNPAREES